MNLRVVTWTIILMLTLVASLAHASSDKIKEVRFSGLQRVEEESVKNVISTQKDSWYSLKVIQEDIRAIYNMGYFTDIQVDKKETDDGTIITFIVEERPSVKEVKLEGNDEIGDDDINEVVDIKPFSVLNFDKIYKNIDKIKTVYIDKGFFLADVEFRLEEEENNQVTVVFVIKERAKVQVKKVIITGNEKIPEKDLLKVMMTKPGDFLSFITNAGQYRHEIIERDAYMLNEYYANHGYINAKIDTPKVYLSPDRKWIYVTINIQEGEQYRLKGVDFSGEMLFSKDKQKRTMKLKPGDVFDRSVFIKDLERIADLYKDLGYAYANVSPYSTLDDENRTVDINLNVQKGGKVWIERINIVGNTKTRDKVIRREMRIAEGDLYSSTKIKKSKFKIYQVGYFEKAEITESPGSSDDKIVLTVEVKERRTGSFQLGFGFSSIDSFVFQAQVNQNNLFGRGQSLSLNAMLSGTRTQFMLRFFEPYLADTKVNFGFSLFNQSYTYPDQGDFGNYSRKSSGADITFGYPFFDDLTLFLTYSIKDVNINTENDLHLHLFKSGLTSSLSFTAQYDTRDNRLFPTKGMLQRLTIEYADDYIGSDIEFVKFSFNSQFFYPVWWKIVFKFNADVGYVMSLEEPDANKNGGKDFPGVPIAERYLLGGIYSVRGFEFGSISPAIEVISQDDPASYPVKYLIGGNKQLILNFEIEFPVIEAAGIKWVFFFDAGNTWSEDQQYFYLGQSGQNEYNLPLGLYMSYGFGLRWYSPIGPLRFEWGLPITKRPQDETIAFEFSIGNQF